MEDNVPMPIRNDDFTEEEPCVLVVPSKGRRRKKRRRGGCLLLLLLLFFGAYKIFPYAQELISSLTPSSDKINDNSTLDSIPDDTNDNEENTEGKYEIKQSFPSESNVIIEASGDLSISTLKYELKGADNVYSIYGESAPVVLITCFSPTECFSNGRDYSLNDSFHSETKSISEIAQHICNLLNQSGIGAMFYVDTFFNGADLEYKRSFEAEISSILENNPSIEYVIDISRDVVINEDMSMDKHVISHNDTVIPCISLTVGTNDTVITDMQRKNTYFAKSLAEFINISSPCFAYKTTISKYPILQSFDAVTLRVDIGSYACSYDEAIKSAELFSEYLEQFLR
ncbi:MAG: stage II sporulation protein P [Clostridia bacterium]|nr:stage II sporulation protein P [Clostridia bacterium]